MYPGGHGQAPGPPGSQPPGPVGPPSSGEGWNPIQGMGGNALGAPGSGLGMGPLGQTILPNSGGSGGGGGGGGPLNQGLGMNPLGTIITSPTGSTPGAASVMPPSNVSPIGSGSLTPPGDTTAPHFLCPRRPNLGREGRQILLRANHFQVSQLDLPPLGRKYQPSFFYIQTDDDDYQKL